MIYQKPQKKEIPDLVTKAFIFEVYLNQMSEKWIRKTLNYYINLLGFNVRKRKLNDIIVIYFIANCGLPINYKLSKKFEKQFSTLGFVKRERSGWSKPKC
jgi:hypothetical protein